MVMKYLIIRLSVMVTGPPASIWERKSGMTEPFEPRTFPNLTAEKVVLLSVRLWTIISHRRFVAPMTFVGLTALSVEMRMNFSAPYFSASSAVLYVPKTLFLTASQLLCSISGTCL